MVRETPTPGVGPWVTQGLGATRVGRQTVASVPREIRHEGPRCLGRETLTVPLFVGLHARMGAVASSSVVVGSVVQKGLPTIEEQTGHEIPSPLVSAHLRKLAKRPASTDAGTGTRGHPLPDGAATAPSSLDRPVLAARASRISRGTVPPVDDQVPIRTGHTRHETLDDASARPYAVPAAGPAATVGNRAPHLGAQVRLARATPMAVPVEALGAGQRLLLVAMAVPTARIADVGGPAPVTHALSKQRRAVATTPCELTELDATPKSAPTVGEGTLTPSEGVALLLVGTAAMGPVAPRADVGRRRRGSVVGKTSGGTTIPVVLPLQVVVLIPMLLREDGPLALPGARVGVAPTLTPLPKGSVRAQAVPRKTRPSQASIPTAVLPLEAALPQVRRTVYAKGVAGL